MNAVTTNDITISVWTQHLPDHSEPLKRRHVFGYLIRITNGSEHTVQLLRRHWIITDSNGIIREVEGEGVVGEQPVILPGEFHEYSSYCNLESEMGKMRGHYLMVKVREGNLFHVEIPEFQMVAPELNN